MRHLAHRALLAAACALALACDSGGDSDTPDVPLETVAAPAFAIPEPVNFGAPLEVAISTATSGAEIRYTMDGTVPTAASTLYDAPFTISETATIQAIALRDGMNPSPVTSVTYTFRPVDLQLDGGTPLDLELVSTAPASHLFLDRFTPAPEDFPFVLRTFRIGHPSAAAGTPVRLAVYTDADGDLQATQATLEGSWDVTLQGDASAPPSLQWSEFMLSPPVIVRGPGDVVLGYTVLPGPESWALLIDQPANGRSYVASFAGTVPNPPELAPASWFPLGYNLFIRGAN